jgi:hypothetical protein
MMYVMHVVAFVWNHTMVSSTSYISFELGCFPSLGLVRHSSFLSHHFCMSVAQGLFYPTSESVLLALFLGLLAPSFPQDTNVPPFIYFLLSPYSYVVATPCLGPSSPATKCYSTLPKSWQSIQTLGLSQGKSSMCQLGGSGSLTGIERIHHFSLSSPLGLLCS